MRLEKRLVFVERDTVSVQDCKSLFLQVSHVKQKRMKRKRKRNRFENVFLIKLRDMRPSTKNVATENPSDSPRLDSEPRALQAERSEVLAVSFRTVLGIAHSRQHILFDDDPAVITN